LREGKNIKAGGGALPEKTEAPILAPSSQKHGPTATGKNLCTAEDNHTAEATHRRVHSTQHSSNPDNGGAQTGDSSGCARFNRTENEADAEPRVRVREARGAAVERRSRSSCGVPREKQRIERHACGRKIESQWKNREQPATQGRTLCETGHAKTETRHGYALCEEKSEKRQRGDLARGEKSHIGGTKT
jgi:hypothetical protein